MIAINIRGVFLSMKQMAAQGFGSVVNMSSGAGLVGVAGFSGYTATKAAEISMTKSSALEVAPLGIRVQRAVPRARRNADDRNHGPGGRADEVAPRGAPGRPDRPSHRNRRRRRLALVRQRSGARLPDAQRRRGIGWDTAGGLGGGRAAQAGVRRAAGRNRRRSGRARPEVLGRQLAVLFEGARALATSLNDMGPFEDAEKLAKALIEGGARPA